MTSSGNNCTYQVRSRIVKEGGSVTIPCSYAVPKDQQKDAQIIWEESDNIYCFLPREDFTLSGDVTEKYAGRVTKEKDPHRNWTEAIRITRLKRSDGPLFCCHLYNTKEKKKILSNDYGTLLHFPDEGYVTQLDKLVAIPSEEVIIPCHYSRKVSDLVQEVTWYATREESHDYCALAKEIHTWRDARQHDRYSLVDFPQDVSLRIHNIHKDDDQYYCCYVYTANRTAITTRQATRLIITGNSSSLHSHQPPDVLTVQEGGSVTLNCSYIVDNPYTESDIMLVSVYWRVGSVMGPYAYHPHQEMVHPTYTERATITGTTNLIIRGVQVADNLSSFHCIVVLKFCTGSNKYEDKIQHGGETRLTVQALYPKSYMDRGTVILAAYVVIKFFTVLVATAVILGRLRRRREKIHRST
ncbi:uncharacterized protein [Hyperolius riggenbachi]|uniref:uncharacterized protein n=1 Tax=Hyperolius riggenbachi TaxID=752182 RepID=UPI0035A36752